MSHNRNTECFYFPELSETAKEKAREWYRERALDYEWFDSVFDDAKTMFAFAGFNIDKIYFSGFCSQGDGAMFEGTWCASDTKPVKEMKAYAPQDKELHRIAAEARSITRSDKEASTSMQHRGHYYHEHCVEFTGDARTPELLDRIAEMARDAMRWIYRTLEKEHDYLLADAQVDETIIINEYEFSSEGKRT